MDLIHVEAKVHDVSRFEVAATVAASAWPPWTATRQNHVEYNHFHVMYAISTRHLPHVHVPFTTFTRHDLLCLQDMSYYVYKFLQFLQ